MRKPELLCEEEPARADRISREDEQRVLGGHRAHRGLVDGLGDTGGLVADEEHVLGVDAGDRFRGLGAGRAERHERLVLTGGMDDLIGHRDEAVLEPLGQSGEPHLRFGDERVKELAGGGRGTRGLLRAPGRHKPVDDPREERGFAGSVARSDREC